ncbi:Putative leucine--tRNA ligase, mitochondrial [Gryllus bimaculatus]|nr:Putative leucine--tRNA ligase, mitochondrial [Gryllus bimaculatus]
MPLLRQFRLFDHSIIDKLPPLIYFKRYLFHGVNRWNEELSTDLKHDIENKWHKHVYKKSEEKNDQPKYYVLSMFPYPSGQLHMGHVRVYTISDTMARFHRMNGKNVIHPMGWDAFGLPAENAAIERNVQPQEWTRHNVNHMRKQLQRLACSFDWERELATSSPAYYKWTQYLFLKLYKSGLVYQKEAWVNWDPVDQTVLADEQVDENGCSWRSGAKVERKLLKQWFVRTTRFSKALCDGLDDPLLENWRDIIKLQKHWIGECNGTVLEFDLESDQINPDKTIPKKTVTVWTQRPEMVFAARFIAISPGSVLDVLYSESSSAKKDWRQLPVRAYNLFTGEFLPIFVTDKVQYHEGTDSHLGTPEASEADRDFAVLANIPTPSTPEEDGRVFRSEDDVKVIRDKVCEMALQRGAGGFQTSAKLRDWLISRQRYWGTPIPLVHCPSCGVVPVPDSQLPVELPPLHSEITKGQAALSEATNWRQTSCPKCGSPAERETDTMDTFVDSSWYFLRFLDPWNTEEPFSKDVVAHQMPVDLYIGGKEHAVLHLYYARFMHHFLHSQGLVPTREPFRKLLVQGMVMGQSYKVEDSGRYIPESEVQKTGRKLVEKGTGLPVVTAWEKMSKSKHNGVDPETMFETYGTDTTRLLILADVAPTSHRHWSSKTFPGILKWQHRLWLTIQNFRKVRDQLDETRAAQLPDSEAFDEQEAKLFDSRNYYVKGATFNYSVTFQLSVAISKMQGLTNSLRRAPNEVVALGRQFERALAVQIILLAPMAPHFASELWAGFTGAPHRVNTHTEEIFWERSVLEQPWPQVDTNYCLELLCRVNGADSCTIRLPRYELDALTHDDALELALSNVDLQASTANRKIIATQFTLHPSYEAVINIATEHVSAKEKDRQIQDV